MSPVIKDLLRVAHKIVTFMCKTHVYLNPFLQTQISMKLWRKTPTTNTLKSVTMSMITTHLTKSCSQSVRCSPLNRHLLKPFLANTYIYKIVEKNSNNKHFEEETQRNNECGHKKTLQELLTEHQIITFISETHTCTKTISCKHICLWGCRENSTTYTLKKKHKINHKYGQKSPYKNRSHFVSLTRKGVLVQCVFSISRWWSWYAEHTLYRNPFPCQWENVILYDKVSERARKCTKGANKGGSYQRICSTSVQWCFA
jgi:hypothetical protein